MVELLLGRKVTKQTEDTLVEEVEFMLFKLDRRLQKASSDGKSDHSIQIFIDVAIASENNRTARRKFKLRCPLSYTLQRLATRVEESFGVEQKNYRHFYYKGHQLEPEETLEYYSVVNASNLVYRDFV